MWSPVGPHVQWDLSNVVTCGTSIPWMDEAAGCILEIGVCTTHGKCEFQDSFRITILDR